MSIPPRFSIDTWYFGLMLEETQLFSLLEEIKNYLFFLPQRENVNYLNFQSCRNRFYEWEYVNAYYGFSIFVKPKPHLLNDFITIQLTGKFFRHIDIANKFCNFILSQLYDYVRFQRLDVAIDLFAEYNGEELDEKTGTFKFPFPSYSPDWHYVRMPFETYGRYNCGQYFINMVSQGSDDIRLRVYDKALDLKEKYKTDYFKYYGLKGESSHIYRIELQLRSDKLKGLVESVMKTDLKFNNVDTVIYVVTQYLLQRYRFEHYEDLQYDNTSFSAYIKRDKSTPITRYNYNRRMQTHYYKETIKSYDEMIAYQKEMKIMNKFMFDKVKKLENDVRFIDIDLEKASERI